MEARNARREEELKGVAGRARACADNELRAQRHSYELKLAAKDEQVARFRRELDALLDGVRAMLHQRGGGPYKYNGEMT